MVLAKLSWIINSLGLSKQKKATVWSLFKSSN